MDLMSDAEGSVLCGWVAPGIYYARFQGKLSAQLGAFHIRALEAATDKGELIRYYCDSHALTSYDMLARSAFARLLLRKRKQFVDLVILNWNGAVYSRHRRRLLRGEVASSVGRA